MNKRVIKKEVSFVCPVCKDVKKPHKADGLCENCYRRNRRGKLSTEEQKRWENQELTHHAEGDIIDT